MSSNTDVSVDQRASQSQRQAGSSSDAQTSFNHVEAERSRASKRRAAMGIVRPAGHENVPWALAFSGGGIRSATFCLGALQGLTQAEAPAQPNNEVGHAAGRRSLLRQFDYLSTVSGGGFIGSFFTSLFAQKRLNLSADLDDKATAEQAYQVFREDPPGRLHSTDQFDAANPGRMPLAWLRENGRYMAPTGGDRMYAATVAIRNWCAMHYVLGTMLVSLYLLLAFT
ncbi:MAG TPA: patatin-like phospholipase family protein, partial [Burkholderiales bacterium]|nr:patatin-like phospholipase family protein [Burkholderiales bacterium]